MGLWDDEMSVVDEEDEKTDLIPSDRHSISSDDTITGADVALADSIVGGIASFRETDSRISIADSVFDKESVAGEKGFRDIIVQSATPNGSIRTRNSSRRSNKRHSSFPVENFQLIVPQISFEMERRPSPILKRQSSVRSSTSDPDAKDHLKVQRTMSGRSSITKTPSFREDIIAEEIIIPSNISKMNKQKSDSLRSRSSGDKGSAAFSRSTRGSRRRLSRKGSSFRRQSSSASTRTNKVIIRIREFVRNCKQGIRTVAFRWKVGCINYFSSIYEFFNGLLDQGNRVPVDLYFYMFWCDFINFFVVIFGFSAFAAQAGDGGVMAYLEESRVPLPFLIMLILQFFLILTDRALYLRKNLLGKLIFQFFLIFGVHSWMFFVLPYVTEREFSAVTPPKMWYFLKCVNLLLAAKQIRSGYPTRILGNCFTKRYGIANNYSFKAFMLVPFLFELRTLMDWVFTATTMSMSEWFKLEVIFGNIFELKCERTKEERYPHKSGEPRRQGLKYLLGGSRLLGIVAIIWFPLVLFALGNTVGMPNPPLQVEVTLKIESYEPFFRSLGTKFSTMSFSEGEWAALLYQFRTDRTAQTFLQGYDHSDLVATRLLTSSSTNWDISLPAINQLMTDLSSNKTMELVLEWKITRDSNSEDVEEVASSERVVELEAFVDGNRNKIREQLVSILRNRTRGSESLEIESIFPKFIKVLNKGSADMAWQLVGDEEAYRSIFLTFNKFDTADGRTEVAWEVRENCTDNVFSWLQYNNCKFLTIYSFSDKAFPATLSLISGGGIIGMYTTLVFVASKVLRELFAAGPEKTIYEELPYVDRILRLCLDIYLVRESGELELEEDLFAKLIFIYRSPATLIRWSKPPTNAASDGNPSDIDGTSAFDL